MSKMVRAALLWLPMMGLTSLMATGCGSGTWEPATIPPETMVPPPPVPGEGKTDDALDAFDGIDVAPPATAEPAAPPATAEPDAPPAATTDPAAGPPAPPAPPKKAP